MRKLTKEEWNELSERLDQPESLMRQIESVRKERGLSISDFCFWADVSVSTYHRYKDDKTVPDVDKMANMAKVVTALWSMEPPIGKKEIKSQLAKILI